MVGTPRLIFTLLAEFMAIACLVLALVNFLGCYQLGPLKNAYMMRIDLSQLEVSGISIFKALGALNIKNDLWMVYQAGLQGCCYGNYNTTVNNTISFQGCYSPETPYWFNLLRILEDSLPSLLFSFISIPESIKSYTLLVKRVNTAAWALTIAEFLLAALVIVVGALDYFSCIAAGFSIAISLLMAACGLAAAVVATATWVIYRNAINSNFGDIGVVATVGPTGFGLAWGAAASGILAFIFYSVAASRYRPRRHETQRKFVEKTSKQL